MQSLNGEPGEELAPEPAPIVRPKQVRFYGKAQVNPAN